MDFIVPHSTPPQTPRLSSIVRVVGDQVTGGRLTLYVHRSNGSTWCEWIIFAVSRVFPLVSYVWAIVGAIAATIRLRSPPSSREQTSAPENVAPSFGPQCRMRLPVRT